MTQGDPQESHIKWLREQLVLTERDIKETERIFLEVEGKLKKLRESAEYFRGVISVVTGQEEEDLSRASFIESESGVRMPKELVRSEFSGMLIRDAAKLIIDGHDKPLHAEELIDSLYDVGSEEERRLIRRSFSSELRRGAEKGWWDKVGKNTFASKKLNLKAEDRTAAEEDQDE